MERPETAEEAAAQVDRLAAIREFRRVRAMSANVWSRTLSCAIALGEFLQRMGASMGHGRFASVEHPMFDGAKEEVRQVTSDFAELSSTSLYWGGSDDRSSMGESITELVDRDGRTHVIEIAEEWQELAPGIMARGEGAHARVRIYREACPVRVRLNSYSTYESYTDWERQSSSSSDRWVRYEAKE